MDLTNTPPFNYFYTLVLHTNYAGLLICNFFLFLNIFSLQEGNLNLI